MPAAALLESWAVGRCHLRGAASPSEHVGRLDVRGGGWPTRDSLPLASAPSSSGNGWVSIGTPGHCFPSCLVPVVVELRWLQVISGVVFIDPAANFAGPAAGGGCCLVGCGGGQSFCSGRVGHLNLRPESRRFEF